MHEVFLSAKKTKILFDGKNASYFLNKIFNSFLPQDFATRSLSDNNLVVEDLSVPEEEDELAPFQMRRHWELRYFNRNNFTLKKEQLYIIATIIL